MTTIVPIIVEGPDGAGKSTLIQEIQAVFPHLQLAPKVVNEKTEAMVDLVSWVEKDNQENPYSIIYDRHRLISELIYGPILRFQTEPGFDHWPWLQRQLQVFYRRKPIIIYCLPPKALVKYNVFSGSADNSALQGEDGRTIERIYDLYLARAAIDYATYSLTQIYDYTRDHTGHIVKAIELRTKP